MSDLQVTEGIKTHLFGGINQAVNANLLKEDFSFLQGLLPNRAAELQVLPGKTKIARLGALPILGFAQFGDNIIVETPQQLVRFTNSELFGGIESSPVINPDQYNIPLDLIEEDLNMVILKYRVASNTNGAAISANTWTTVPFTNEDADTGSNCSLAGSGEFTLTNAVYPVNVRIKGNVCFKSSATNNFALSAQLKLETSAGSFIVSGVNAGSTSGPGGGNLFTNGNAEILGRFALAASTTYRVQIYVTAASTFGLPLNSGSQEVYGQLEILFESTTTPIADGVIPAANYGVSITTEGGRIITTA